jgi:hypothetical protein
MQFAVESAKCVSWAVLKILDHAHGSQEVKIPALSQKPRQGQGTQNQE